MAASSNQEREIFVAALDRTTLAERAAYLDGACGDDAELRAKVGELLSAHELAGGFLAMNDPVSPGVDFAKEAGANFMILPVSEKPGDRIGRYKILEKVGEGGCGVVYVAEQEQPVRRRIALKVIKLGMDSKAIVARFEAERQALAMMDHPNIAKVFEAGATETGRPYFVMELVRGIKITDYCDQNRLSIRQRLDLFVKVCQAIQNAHQKGIIHRDIKPSNILVTLHDGVPVPKIIDFGIAKATAGRLTDLTVYTDLHQFIGTPAYMSPEQAEMSGLDIDTRTDIYSLGVLLYELLTGQTPFDPKALIQSGLDGMRKTIRETEPIRPSTRLNTMLASDLSLVAERHAAEPLRLISVVRGDLDWIVMKALEKDRRRRYETANGLAMDVQRHLQHEPIVARPQSFTYRFQKLVRRNQLAFAAAGAVLIALALGIVGVIWQWRASVRNGSLAEANLYAADMNRAAQVLEDLGPVAARGLLEHHLGESKLHGFEWRYLWERCRGDYAFSFPSHGNPIWKLVYSPDGNKLAVLEHGRTLRLLDVKSGTESLCLTNVTGLGGFTSDGKEMVLIVDSGSSKRLIRFNPFTRGSSELAITTGNLGWLPNLLAGHQTAVVPEKGTELSLVDLRSGTLKQSLNLPDNGYRRWGAVGEACAVSHNEQFVVSLDNGNEEGTTGILSVREIDSGKILTNYRDAAPDTPRAILGDRIYVLRFSPDNKTVLWANRDGYLRQWRWTDSGSQPLIENGHRGVVWDIDYSPDGRSFATAGDDQTVRLWDAENLRVKRVFRGHQEGVFTVAFSPNGKWLASAGGDGTVKLWDLLGAGSSGEIPVVAARELSNRIIFSPDGRSVAVGADDDSIRVISRESGQVAATFNDLLLPVRFSMDGQRVFGLSGVGNLVSGRVERTNELTDTGYAWAQDVSPDGALMIRSFRSSTRWDDVLELLDAQRGSVITNFTYAKVVAAAQFMRDGRTILTSDGDGILGWWLADSKELRHLRDIRIGHFSRAMAISPDGRTVALGGVSRLSLVDYESGRIKHRLFGHAHEITGLAFSPDGGTLASCSMDGTIKLWNLRMMQDVCTVVFDVKPTLGKELGVQAIAFTPDGDALWACSRSGALKYWRAAKSDEIIATGATSKP